MYLFLLLCVGTCVGKMWLVDTKGNNTETGRNMKVTNIVINMFFLIYFQRALEAGDEYNEYEDYLGYDDYDYMGYQNNQDYEDNHFENHVGMIYVFVLFTYLIICRGNKAMSS